ncbi:MAG: formylglycine-generating enzyme family protein [Aggregatilineales bacterium]
MTRRLWLIFTVLVIFLVNTPSTITANHLNAGEVIVDQYGFEMVYVPAGRVTMGIERGRLVQFIEQGAFLDVPESQVDLILDIYEEQGAFETIDIEVSEFWIDRYEVTIEQYLSRAEYCMGTGRCNTLNLPPELMSDPNQPQVGIDWFDALRFCVGRGARLATEHEWEYAASGSENLIFPWGNTLVYENISIAVPTIGVTYPVGSKRENISWVGAYDMAGNAAEWVEDRLLPYAFDSDLWALWSSTPNFDTQRVMRGGSYYSSTALETTTFARISRNSQSASGGIRCVRSANPNE